MLALLFYERFSFTFTQPLFISRQIASPGRNNKARVFIASEARQLRPGELDRINTIFRLH
jgi:hypothetical protein